MDRATHRCREVTYPAVTSGPGDESDAGSTGHRKTVGMSQLSASVVIPTRGRRDAVTDVIRALLLQPAAAQVVVVVDGDTDGTAPHLRATFDDQRLLVVELPQNQGRAAARAHGAAVTTGDVVVLLDDDMVPSTELVARHLAHHTAPDRVVVGYSPVVAPERSGSIATIAQLYAEEYERTVASYRADPEHVLRRLWGGNLSIHKQSLAKVPLASGAFVLDYHEDTDFGLRCLEAGLRGTFAPDAVAEHRHARTPRAFLDVARTRGEAIAALNRIHGTARMTVPSCPRWLLRAGGNPMLVRAALTVAEDLPGTRRTIYRALRKAAVHSGFRAASARSSEAAA